MPLILPGIAVIGALLALLILYGGKYVGQFVSNIIPDWHIPGFSSLRSAVAGLVDDAVAGAAAFLSGAVGDVAKIIAYPVRAAVGLFDAIDNAIGSVFGYSVVVLHTAQHLYNLARTYAHDLATAVQHEAEHLYNLARTYAHDLANDVLHTAQHLYNLATAYAARLASDVLHTAQHLYNLARDYSAQLTAELRHDLTALLDATAATLGQAIAAVDHFARAAYADTIGRIDDLARQLEADIATAAAAAQAAAVHSIELAAHDASAVIWPDVVAGVEGAIDAAGDGFTDVIDALREIDLTKVADVAGVATLAGAASIALTRYLKECGMPNCRNLSHYGRDLQALLGLAEGAGILALITELATNPTGTAHEIRDTLGGVADDTLHAARTLIGV